MPTQVHPSTQHFRHLNESVGYQNNALKVVCLFLTKYVKRLDWVFIRSVLPELIKYKIEYFVIAQLMQVGNVIEVIIYWV